MSNTEHFSALSPATAEALAFLVEELAEAQQAIGKILRHGLFSCHPVTGVSNHDALVRELGDVRAAMTIATRLGIVQESELHQTATDKLDRVGVYLHHIECSADRTVCK